MPVVDLAARAACCLAVGLRQVTKAVERPSFRKSAELKRHLYQEHLFRVADSLDPGSDEYVLPPDTPRRELIRSHSVSSGFENSTYNSLNAFRFINAKGAAVPVRWSMVPAQPFEPISTADPGQADKNYLFDALIVNIHNNPL
jgi:hypothetical protein